MDCCCSTPRLRHGPQRSARYPMTAPTRPPTSPPGAPTRPTRPITLSNWTRSPPSPRSQTSTPSDRYRSALSRRPCTRSRASTRSRQRDSTRCGTRARSTGRRCRRQPTSSRSKTPATTSSSTAPTLSSPRSRGSSPTCRPQGSCRNRFSGRAAAAGCSAAPSTYRSTPPTRPAQRSACHWLASRRPTRTLGSAH